MGGKARLQQVKLTNTNINDVKKPCQWSTLGGSSWVRVVRCATWFVALCCVETKQKSERALNSRTRTHAHAPTHRERTTTTHTPTHHHHAPPLTATHHTTHHAPRTMMRRQPNTTHSQVSLQRSEFSSFPVAKASLKVCKTSAPP